MESVNDPGHDTVSCPRCGGVIRAAAKVCKHCQHEVTPIAPVTDSATPSPTVPVLDALRVFIVAKGLVSREIFDVVAQSVTSDASSALTKLAEGGHLTAVQVDSLREGFRQEQHAHLRRLLDDAEKRGLLMATHVQSAIANFDAAVFAMTPEDYLVENALLTRGQIASAAVDPIWKRATRDPATRTLLLAGPAALLVAVPLALVVGRALGTAHDWLMLPLLFAPIAAVVVVARRQRASWGRTSAWFAGTFAFGLVVLGLAQNMGIGARPAYVAPLRPNCTMNGQGEGECVFTNLGTNVAASCGEIVAECRPRRGTPESRTSESICSGGVAAGQMRRIRFTVAEFDRVRDRAVPYLADWRNYCSFAWEPR